MLLPTDILLTTEVIDVFKQFTSVPIPGGLKFSIHHRASLKQNRDLPSLSLGSVVCLNKTEQV